MMEALIKVVDRLISLVRERQMRNRRFFQDHIEPLFADLSIVRKDYFFQACGQYFVSSVLYESAGKREVKSRRPRGQVFCSSRPRLTE